MNFKEWFDSQTKIGYPVFLDYISALRAWEASKSQIAKMSEREYDSFYSNEEHRKFLDKIKNDI